MYYILFKLQVFVFLLITRNLFFMELESDSEEKEPVFMGPMVDSFTGIHDVEDIEFTNLEEKLCEAASVQNPNKDDNRRLFQERKAQFFWDSNVPYEEQPKRLELDGPVPLDWPGHWYQCEGGIVVIYFEKERSTAVTCCLKSVNEVKRTFLFQVFHWQGKSRKTFFDTGKDLKASESDV